MMRIAPLALVAWSVWALSGCRFSYETLAGDAFGGAPGDGDGDGDGRGDGDGDGDGDTGGTLRTGGETGVGGDATGGGASGGRTGGTNSGGGGADAGGSGGSTGGSVGGTDSGGTDTGGVAATGGAGTGGGELGSGGSGTGGAQAGTGGVLGDYVVDTGVDEDDGGGSTGTGLSLREAITFASATVGEQVITFEPDVDVVLTLGSLPRITESLQIIGTGNRIDAVNQGDSQATFLIEADDVVIQGINVENSPSYPALFNTGANARVENCEFRNNAAPLLLNGPSATIWGNLFQETQGDCLSVQASSPVVRENRAFDCGGDGLFFDKDADGALIVGNLIVRAAANGLGFGGLTGAEVWFNTIVDSGTNGILVGQTSTLDLRNDIIVGSGGFGVNGADSNFTSFSHNLIFGSGNGACNGCTLDATIVTSDPAFIEPAGTTQQSFQLQVGSPAIDAGLDLGEDRNGSASGSYDGVAPDLGFWESNY